MFYDNADATKEGSDLANFTLGIIEFLDELPRQLCENKFRNHQLMV